MRVAAWSVVLLLPASVALADVPPPLCGDPDILDQVELQMRRAGRPVAFEAGSVGEVSTGPAASAVPGRPTGPSRIIQCAVRGHAIAYDTTRYGNAPVDEIFVVHYSLELRQNGVFVRIAR